MPHQKLTVKELSKLIKDKALELGFDDCGISKAEPIPDHEKPLFEWIGVNKGYHPYIEKNTSLRTNASELFDDAKSVISLTKNYFPERKQKGKYIIAKYAYGNDYHVVIKNKLYELASFIKSLTGDFKFKAFVDSSPILEKAYAVKAGLGQIGKNNLLIGKNGSFCFVSEMIVNFELDYVNIPQKDICGDCNRCIDACPTKALYKPYHIDVYKCISALTIELKGPVPEEFRGKTKNRIYGCDICQDVCPYNKNPKPHSEPLFTPLKEIMTFNDADWESLTEEQFNKIFRDSSIKRIKHKKFLSNIVFNK
jgi:epoxyqueuosine reductase